MLFALILIVAPACQTGPRASTGKFSRFSGGFARSATGRAGGSGPAARQCASSSAIPWQTGPEEPGARHKPAFKPAWKTTGLSRLAHSRNPGWRPRRHRVRTCRAPDRPEGAIWAAGRARHRKRVKTEDGTNAVCVVGSLTQKNTRGTKSFVVLAAFCQDHGQSNFRSSATEDGNAEDRTCTPSASTIGA